MAFKVFIADDHYLIVEGIHSLLKDEPAIEWLGHAMNASSCLAFLREQQPHVLLLDINMPDKSGIDLCLEIKTSYPEIRIIALSSFNQLSYINKMLQNGASGYLLKNAGKTEIIEAIETVMMGKKYLSLEAATIIRESRNYTTPVITRREKEVLNLIAEGFTNNQIAEQLFISAATVDTHRTSLLTKFEVKNTASLIRVCTQQGLL